MNSIIQSSEDHIKKFPNDGPSKLDIEESNYHAWLKLLLIYLKK